MKNLKRILYNVFLSIGCIIFICSIELPCINVFCPPQQEFNPAIYPRAIFSIPFFVIGLIIYLLDRKE